jgi:hypothetical protein
MINHIKDATIKMIEIYAVHVLLDINQMDLYTAFRYVSRLARTIPMQNSEDYASVEHWIELDRNIDLLLNEYQSILSLLEQLESALEKSSSGWLNNFTAPSAADFLWKSRIIQLSNMYMNFTGYPHILEYNDKKL